MTRRFLFAIVWLGVACGASSPADAQVTEQRLVNSAKEPQNWLNYSGRYFSQRYSTLNQITPANVKNLELKWIYQTRPRALAGDAARGRRRDVRHAAANDVVALDAKTGRVFWTYQYTPVAEPQGLLRGEQSRTGHLGRHVVHGDVDAHLVAIDTKDGHALWNTAGR